MGKTRQGYCPIVKGQENSEKERINPHVLTEFYMFFVQQESFTRVTLVLKSVQSLVGFGQACANFDWRVIWCPANAVQNPL